MRTEFSCPSQCQQRLCTGEEQGGKEAERCCSEHRQLLPSLHQMPTVRAVCCGAALQAGSPVHVEGWQGAGTGALASCIGLQKVGDRN